MFYNPQEWCPYSQASPRIASQSTVYLRLYYVIDSSTPAEYATWPVYCDACTSDVVEVEPSVKIGLISDIHADPKALRRVLADMPSIDRLWCAGDAVSEYQFCAETVQVLLEARAECIQGNHERVLFGGANRRYLSKCQAEFGAPILEVLATAPTTHAVEVDGARLLMVHASPWKPFEEYIFPGSPRLPHFAQLPYDFVILGHTHVAMLQHADRVTIVNPGSCSQPRDQDPRGSYAVLDTAQRTVDLRRVRLD